MKIFLFLCFNLLIAFQAVSQVSTFQVQTAHTGNWYDPQQSGHGFLVEVFGDGRALVWWFTFDDNGNRTWLGNVGQVEGDSITLDVLEFSGGFFPPNFDPNLIEFQIWGQMTFKFINCNQAVVDWVSNDSSIASGQMELTRITLIQGLTCEPPVVVEVDETIGYSSTIPTLDGMISPGEWDNALNSNISVNGNWNIPLKLQTNGNTLFVAFENLAGPGNINDVQEAQPNTLFPEVFIHTNQQDLSWNRDSTHWFHASFMDCYRSGNWNSGVGCRPDLSLWDATNWPLFADNVSEFQIEYERLNLEPNQPAIVNINLSMTSALLGDQVYYNWPTAAAVDTPSTWIKVLLPTE